MAKADININIMDTEKVKHFIEETKVVTEENKMLRAALADAHKLQIENKRLMGWLKYIDDANPEERIWRCVYSAIHGAEVPDNE